MPNIKSQAKKDADLLSRLEKYTPKLGADECWPWMGPTCGAGHKIGKGYPSLTVNRKKVLVTRLVYQLRHKLDRLPLGSYVCHACDNPPCVNPSHLFLGDAKANHEDVAKKGRSAAKIPANTVREVRRLRLLGRSYGSIASQTKISKSAVAHILKKRTRQFVKD